MAPKRAPLSLKLCVPLLVGIGWLMNVDFGTKRAKEGVLFLASLSAGLFATLYRRCMKSIEERASPTDTVCIVVDGKAELKTVLDHDKEALVELLSQGLLVRRVPPELAGTCRHRRHGGKKLATILRLPTSSHSSAGLPGRPRSIPLLSSYAAAAHAGACTAHFFVRLLLACNSTCQTLLQPLNIFEHAVFQVHVMGADDSKPPYERPWASMLPQRQWEQASSLSGDRFRRGSRDTRNSI
jgi:hypothetical protein